MTQDQDDGNLTSEQWARLLKADCENEQQEGHVVERGWAPMSVESLGELDAELVDTTETLEKLLLGSKVDLATITALKSRGKFLVRGAKTEACYDIAVAVYYAAVASALVHFDRKISKLPNEDLDKAFGALIGRVWMTEGLRDLFERARAICREESDQQSGEQAE
ncbi:MAG: hypothetical protein ISS69_11095 [Phycisphaerae bacterium]|nr:hypothetical protein [Phycisphaerae bacterium]